MPFGGLFYGGGFLPSYSSAIERLRQELAQLEKRDEELTQEQEDVRERMQQCNAAIEALAPLSVDEEVDNSPGLSELCEDALLKLGTTAVTFPELRGFLESMGVDMTRYKNGLAVLHTTVLRLKKAGKARIFKKNGKTYCQAEAPTAGTSFAAHLAGAPLRITPEMVAGQRAEEKDRK